MQESTLDITLWFVLSTALHTVAFSGVTLHALKRRRNASATVLWVFIAWSIPIFGPLLYLSFGIDRVSSKASKKQITNEMVLHQRDQLHKDNSSFNAWHLDYHTRPSDIENPISRKLNALVDTLNPDHPLLGANQIEPLVSGDAAYPLMLEAIRSAKHHIHLQSFIIYRDDTGKRFLDALRVKAEEGVKVRILFDRFGSTHAYLGGMFRAFRNVPNFEICGWTQANPFKAQFQINLRNHRKNLVIDGQVAFFGGVNISCENISSRQQPAIRDYHFKVEGPLVHELQLSFLSDWYFMTRQPMEMLLDSDLFPKMLSVGNARARLIDSGPSAIAGLVSDTFFNTITMAQKQILVVTPYFVPTPDILKALRSAALRGLDVRIVVPEFNNHKYAGMASKALYEELMEAGAKIYQRKPPFIHAKAMVVDDSIALVGTANLDVRSLELNYETTVLFEDEITVNKLKRIIHEDIESSREIILNEWINRPTIQKLGENLFSLMTPIL